MHRLLLLIPLFIIPAKDSLISYGPVKQKAIDIRDSLRSHYNANTITIDSTFTHIVVNDLIPYWYGTPWDFNGMTQRPGQGQIACGYFVTTILRDAGFKVNRVKTAQKPASEIIREVADKNTIRAFSLQRISKIDSAVKKMGTGLYVVGLDFHVGFLYCDGSEVYFIHSNYIGREGVIKESIFHSRAFVSSKLKVIGKVSTQNCLTKNWLRL